jgi:hypothetical protein
MSSGGQEEPKQLGELQKICQEEKVMVEGKEVYISPELRQRLYQVVLSCLPLRHILNNGKTPENREELAKEGKYREAAAVSMKDENILTDKKMHKEVKGYLENDFSIIDDLLKENEYALYAIITFGHTYVKNYTPKKQQDSILERAEKGEDLGTILFGKSSTK